MRELGVRYVRTGLSWADSLRSGAVRTTRVRRAMSLGLQTSAPGWCAVMAKHDVIVIGASAGGVEAISRVVADLPRDLHASVFVVLHVSRGRSLLPEILSRPDACRPRILPTERRSSTEGSTSLHPTST